MAHRPRVAHTITALGAALALIVAVLTLTSSAFAVEPDEIMADPALEARAREISKGLRCVVCQNQSIDDSNAELARDLRVLVRERLRQGDSDSDVVAYVVSRYGDFVLLKPPFKAATYALWIGPAVILAVGVLAVVLFYRRRRSAGVANAPPPLTPAEQRRVDALLARKQP